MTQISGNERKSDGWRKLTSEWWSQSSTEENITVGGEGSLLGNGGRVDGGSTLTDGEGGLVDMKVV